MNIYRWPCSPATLEMLDLYRGRASGEDYLSQIVEWNHLSGNVGSGYGGPKLTVGRTIFEMWLEL